MSEEINEPKERPKERIEHLLSTKSKNREKRVFSRLEVEPGAEVYFPLVCKGEVMDISEDGISVRFKPLEAPSLQPEQSIELTIPLDQRSFTIDSTIKRIESRFGVFVVGMSVNEMFVDEKETSSN